MYSAGFVFATGVVVNVIAEPSAIICVVSSGSNFVTDNLPSKASAGNVIFEGSATATPLNVPSVASVPNIFLVAVRVNLPAACWLPPLASVIASFIAVLSSFIELNLW